MAAPVHAGAGPGPVGRYLRLCQVVRAAMGRERDGGDGVLVEAVQEHRDQPDAGVSLRDGDDGRTRDVAQARDDREQLRDRDAARRVRQGAAGEAQPAAGIHEPQATRPGTLVEHHQLLRPRLLPAHAPDGR